MRIWLQQSDREYSNCTVLWPLVQHKLSLGAFHFWGELPRRVGKRSKRLLKSLVVTLYSIGDGEGSITIRPQPPNLGRGRGLGEGEVWLEHSQTPPTLNRGTIEPLDRPERRISTFVTLREGQPAPGLKRTPHRMQEFDKLWRLCYSYHAPRFEEK